MRNIFKNIDILSPKDILAVEAIYIAENNWEFQLVNVKKVKNSVQFDSIRSVASTTELFQLIKSKTQVSLVVTGRGIINRKVAVQNNDDKEKIIQKIFPDAQVNDFVTQIFDINDNLKLVSIARIDIIENLIALFSKNKIPVVDVNIGPFGINNIIPLLNNVDSVICNSFKLKIKDNVIYDFEITENIEDIKYLVSDAPISSKSLIAFASGINYLVNFKESNSSEIILINENKKEHYYANLFKYGGWAMLIFFFVLLLINFLLFENYNKKFQKISLKVSEYNYLLTKYDTLNNDLKSKKKFLEESGLLNNIKLSFFADRVVSDLPKNIKLTELNIFPLKEKQQKMKEAEFIRNTIYIKGLSQNGTFLNDWVKILKTYKWIAEVNIVDFIQENFATPALFNIEIKIK